MAYVVKMYAGSDRHFVTKSEPGTQEQATEWVNIMTRALSAKGYERSLYDFTIEQV